MEEMQRERKKKQSVLRSVAAFAASLQREHEQQKKEKGTPSEMLHLLLTPDRGGAGQSFLALQTRPVALFKDKVVAFGAEHILMARRPAPFANRERRNATTFSDSYK